MKLTDYKNEDALELLADILEPVANVLSDEKVVKLIKTNAPKIRIVTLALKEHSKDIIEVLARINGVSPKDYSANILEMTNELLELLNDEALQDFFISQQTAVISSGNATENTEE